MAKDGKRGSVFAVRISITAIRGVAVRYGRGVSSRRHSRISVVV